MFNRSATPCVLLLHGLAIGTAAQANTAPGVEPGGCYTDDLGRCKYAPPELAAPEASPADEAARGTTADQKFAYVLTHDVNTPKFVIMDFDTVKGQGLRACQQRSNGGGTEVVDDLTQAGGYTISQAVAVMAAAAWAYCPWILKLDAPAPTGWPPTLPA